MTKLATGLSIFLLAQFAAAICFSQPTTNPAPGGGRGGGGGNQANYSFPYRPATVESINEVLNRVLNYVDANTASRLVTRQGGEPVTDFSKVTLADVTLEQKPFQIVSYEWGVTYAGMILAADNTGDKRFSDYVAKRLQVFEDGLPLVRAGGAATNPAGGARGGGRGGLNLRGLTAPTTLDDCGAMCAGLIKADRAQIGPNLRSAIDTMMDFISNKQFRFKDGTLARTRPFPETMWLDDLYMSVPALAQMGKMTGEKKYYDDACKQILQFGQRMFVPEKGLWMHGWSTNTDDHPTFYWARANGWAAMAMVELLEVLPEDHPQRAEVMKLLKAHIKGLAQCQSGDGLWHQLLDRSDTYLETSASAMYVFAMARAINRGWISPVTYGPIAQIGWQAVTTKVNQQGQVEGTCVGTDLAYDAAYYYARPTSPLAAHGYGPVLLAGAEMIPLIKSKPFQSTFGVIHQTENAGGGFGGGGRGGRGRGQ